MSKQKILFIDRDGTLITEPVDEQIDHLNKFKLEPYVIAALLKLQQAGFIFVMVSNQDGLGTSSFPQADFEPAQQLLLELLQSQGISFADILICPHFASDQCECRKPKLGLVLKYLSQGKVDLENSFVIGDRDSDLQLAKNMGISGILYQREKNNWPQIANALISKARQGKVERFTNETRIEALIKLDDVQPLIINTGIGFFDHMLEQLAKHGGFSLELKVEGDLNVDEHHTVEDTALVLGEALAKALGDKRGINRYGFLLPMDEALCQVAIDLSGRSYFVFEGQFTREQIGGLPTELIPHFFRSFAETLKAALHIKVQGENNHHMVESIFKGVGRALRMAIYKQGDDMPSTKGVL